MLKRALVVGAIIVDDLDHPQRVLGARRSRRVNLAAAGSFPAARSALVENQRMR